MEYTHDKSRDRFPQPNEELSSRFGELLSDTADLLEANCRPEIHLHEIHRIPFGQYRDHTLMTSRTNDHDYHTGFFSLASNEETNGFVARKKLGDNGLWQIGDKFAKPSMITRLIDSNWPIDADKSLLDPLLDRVREHNEPSTRELLEVLEAFGASSESSFATDEKLWSFHDITRLTDDIDEIRTVSLNFETLLSGDGLRQVKAELTFPFDQYEHEDVPMRCAVTVDELGDVFVSAAYRDADTGKETVVAIQNFEGLYDELSSVIEQLISEKIDPSQLA